MQLRHSAARVAPVRRGWCVVALAKARPAPLPGRLIHIVIGDQVQQRRMKSDRDFEAFHLRCLLKVKNPANLHIVEPRQICELSELEEGALYRPLEPEGVHALQGWKTSMVLGGEKASSEAAVTFLRRIRPGDQVASLQTTGQLRVRSGTSLGQVDGGAVTKDLVLLVSTKTRGLPGDVDALQNTMDKILRYRDRQPELLHEFRNRRLVGALAVDALPEDPDDYELLMGELTANAFLLFERNGNEYGCSAPGLPS
ncbi:hypothetical protein HYH03_017445 [Edaphochlamys debaryana]|uniref:Uncharacterized protein n=1 Tax=Edaphochlamys debaryana TaxID=47281 RepID=A0A835XIG1_9CHLO|nr:hypothetical protein HYH03_017445 [Edaphochlamys debaryana]|eukprot:KAG2483727.1 hypothetical protein HYH03_017445 [Edaphochlamys debaryana]